MEAIRSIIGKIEKGVCIAAVIALVLIAASEAAARLFGSYVPASTSLMTHILLLLGLFSGMYTTGTKEHLSIVLIQYVKNEKLKKLITATTGFIAIFICTIIFWSSISLIKISIEPRLVGFIPNLVFIMAMPICYGIMTIRFVMQMSGNSRVLPILAVILGSAWAFTAIAKIIWGIDLPDVYYDVFYLFSDTLFLVQAPLIILLIIMALMGAPLFIIIAGVAMIIIQAEGGQPEAVNNSIFTSFTDTNIIAIPLFTVTGFILSESRAGERLVNCFRSLFSWIPGGMIIVTVILCAFFTSFTGASGVTILALGGILFTVLHVKSAYPERFTIGLLTSASWIGLLFPPSLPIILVGATSRTNIIHMFLGAIIPGVILVAAMIIMGIIASIKNKIPVEPFRVTGAASSVKGSTFEILLPFILMIGYFSGIFSLVEIGAISVIYVFIIEVLIYKDIKLKDLPKVFYKALPIIGGLLSIIAVAKALSYAIVYIQAPENFAIWIRSAIQSKYLFLLLLNISLFAIGCFMDIFSAILVILPLVTPLGAVYGIDPVHMGVIFLINMGASFLTPPVGINLFLASYCFKKPFVEICRNVLPFFLVQVAVVFLITYVPVFSTFLPRFF